MLIAAKRVMLLAIDQREEMPPAIVSHVACAGNRARLPAAHGGTQSLRGMSPR